MKSIHIHDKHIKTLFVCSGNKGRVSPFILDQKKALESRGISVDLFPIQGKGVKGYLKSLKVFISKIKANSYNLIHAHYGLSGLLACLQFRLPVVVTLHGSDVNDPNIRIFSRITSKLANSIIVVSDKMKKLLKADNSKVEVIPCGVDLNLFHPMDKQVARQKLESLNKFKFEDSKKYILFSSSFNMDVKNPQLAQRTVKALGDSYELIELDGYSREEVVLLLNSVDVAFMTSRTEGSPQFIKEAMACNCPIVTTDVGDVRDIINNTEGCFISTPAVRDLAVKLKKASNNYGKTEGRKRIPEKYKEKEVINQVLNNYQHMVEEEPKQKGFGKINFSHYVFSRFLHRLGIHPS